MIKVLNNFKESIFFLISKIVNLYYEYPWQNFNDHTSKLNEIEFNIENNIVKIKYEVNGFSYQLIYKSNLNNNFMKSLLECNNPKKTILSARINNKYNITELVNEFLGPYGDFYNYENIYMKLSWIIPDIYHKDFKILSIIDENGDLYEFTSLDDVLSRGIHVKYIQYNYFLKILNITEKNELIRKCPYI